MAKVTYDCTADFATAQKRVAGIAHGLNYLNTAEIKSFCKRHSIPYTIAIESKNGHRRTTKDDDRKAIVLDRIRHFLRTGVILKETCFPATVVCFDPLPNQLEDGE